MNESLPPKSGEDVSLLKDDRDGVAANDRPIEDIDTALDEIGLGWFHLYLFITCGAGFMTDAMEVTLLAFLYNCLTLDWDLSSSTGDLVTSCVFLGELCGSLVLGNLSDRMGRRPIGLIGNAFVFIGGLLSATADNVQWFILWRTCVGFGIGSFIVPFDMISEMIPRKWRGTFMMLYEFWWAFGSCYTIVMAWLILNAKSWRVLIIVNTIPALISIVMMWFLPESPRWLLSNGNTEEAEKVLEMIARWNGTCCPMLQFKPPLKKEGEENTHGDFSKLLTLPVRLHGMYIIWAAFGFVFYGMSYVVADLFEADDDGRECDFDYSYLLLIYSTEFLGAAFPLMTIDSWGRVQTQVFWYVTSGASVLIVGLVHDSFTQLIASGVFMTAMMAASSVTWVHTPELYSTEIRSSAHCVANACTRLAAASASYWAYSGYSQAIVTGLFAIVCFLAAGLAFVLPETANIILV